MAAGDGNISQVSIRVLHDTDIGSHEVASGSRTAGIKYEPWDFTFKGPAHVGKKALSFVNAGATAGTTTTLSGYTSVQSLVLRNNGAYDVEAAFYTKKGGASAAVGTFVIVASGTALATCGVAAVDFDASPYYAKAGDFIYLQAAETEADRIAWPIRAVAAAAATDQISLGVVGVITANAADTAVIPQILSFSKVLIPAKGGTLLVPNIFAATNLVCYGLGGASVVEGCALVA